MNTTQIRSAYIIVQHEWPQPFPFEEAISFLENTGYSVSHKTSRWNGESEPIFLHRWSVQETASFYVSTDTVSAAEFIAIAKSQARKHIWQNILFLCNAADKEGQGG